MAVSGLTAAGSLVAQVVVASLVGPSRAYDAYVVAIGVPTLVVLVGHSSTINGLVPLLARVGGRETHVRRASQAATMVSLAGAGIAAAIALLAPAVVRAQAPGFTEETARLAVDLTRVVAVGLLFDLSRGALVALHLDAQRVLWPQLVSAAFYPVWTLLAVLLYPTQGPIGLAEAYAASHAVLWSAMLASGLRLGLLRFQDRVRLAWLRPLAAATVPVAGTVLVSQGTALVDRAVASFLPSPSISLLTYGARPADLFARTITMAVGMAFLPSLSRCAAGGDLAAFARLLGQVLRMVVLAALLAAVIAVTLRRELVTAVFVRGAFGPADGARVATLLAWYGAAIVPQSVFVILTYAFYGLGLLRPLVGIGVAALVLATLLDAAAASWWGVEGIARASLAISTLSALAAGLAIAGRLRRRGEPPGRWAS